jgi:D-cysteine desulfhydrase family pyridoxal phosphate-dependent enzyme
MHISQISTQRLKAFHARRAQIYGLYQIRTILPLFFALYPPFPKQQASAFAFMSTPNQAYPYEPPAWALDTLTNTPEHGRLNLGNLPTPLYRMNPFTGSEGINFFVKRDDMTGGPELGGNKIRKLEFLLADALANNYDSVVTIGGEQSNHCRATAAAARMVNLEPHLILRSKRAMDLTNFGYTGNILVDRMVGSTLYTCTPGEYGRLGSNELVRRLCAYIASEGDKNNNRPYPIPVGGSNGLGSWGYINGVYELLQQWESSGFGSLDHVVFACGSGGTAAGIALGIALAYLHAGADSAEIPIVHAMGVCDDPEYFYDYVAKIADEMGFTHSSTDAGAFVRQHLVVHQAEGLGYAASTPEELDFVSNFAVETGVVLDPVYSGKALYHFLTQVVQEDSDEYQGKNVLFWHTGGALGLYDKGEALVDTLNQISPVKRLDVYGKGGKDEVKI